MRLEDFELLVTLHQTKNLTQAAREIFMTQPALTKRLQSIEKEYGCTIVERTNKGLIFTTCGEYLVQRAYKICEFQRQTQQRIQEFMEEKENEVCIASPNTFTKHYLPYLLRRFNIAYPDMKFQINVDHSSFIPHHVKIGNAQCGFMFGDVAHSFNAHKLDSQACYAISSKKLTFEDLANEPLILYSRNEATTESVLKWWYEHNKVSPKIGMTVSDLDTALCMVRVGFGYCIAFCRNDYVMAKDLFRIPLYNTDGTPFTRNTWFLYPDEDKVSENVKTFISFVLQEYHMDHVLSRE